ncbi:MAG: glycoside hydrolase family 75 protein [Akkermansia sp.]
MTLFKTPAAPVAKVVKPNKQRKKPSVQVVIPPEHPAELELLAWDPKDSFAMPIINLPPFPPALPERVEEGQYDHINQMGRGVSIHSHVNFAAGTTAAKDRELPEAYQLKVSLNLTMPQAGGKEDLLAVNPDLPHVLAGFDRLMDAASVSPWYHALMLHKQNRVRKNAATLSRVLDRHNFYDTETILQIEAPDSKRKLVWIQADMDVVSDGSDGDRLPDMPKAIRESDHYQPTTSYRWKKMGSSPNPLLPHWRERVKSLQKNRGSASAIQQAKNTIFELERYSFLLADYDPFIVLSLTMREGKSDYKAQVGDYVVVIVGKKAYPAIVGDYGPTFKSGEASLRLCKEINPKATVYSRPVSDLTVSYLVFPGSKAEEHGPIDYKLMYERCSVLLNEIGGLGEGIVLQKLSDKLPSMEEILRKQKAKEKTR